MSDADVMKLYDGSFAQVFQPSSVASAVTTPKEALKKVKASPRRSAPQSMKQRGAQSASHAGAGQSALSPRKVKGGAFAASNARQLRDASRATPTKPKQGRQRPASAASRGSRVER